MSNTYQSPEQSADQVISIEARRQRTYQMARYNAQRGLAANLEVLRAVNQLKLGLGVAVVGQMTEALTSESPLLTPNQDPKLSLVPRVQNVPEAGPSIEDFLAPEQATFGDFQLDKIRREINDAHTEQQGGVDRWAEPQNGTFRQAA